MNSNFEFLQDKFPILYQIGVLAEKYLYSDANSCLIKLGMMGETIVVMSEESRQIRQHRLLIFQKEKLDI